MKKSIVFFSIVTIFCLDGCKKYERSGNVADPGIVLTFDDTYVDNWYQYLPLLDSFGAKATFYISSYHNFTKEQKDKLKEIERHGNEIAFHTSNHYNLVDYLRYNNIEKLLQYEIYDDLKQMNKDGFYPTTFAYPYGAHDEYLNYRLLKIFKSVRVLNGTHDYSQSATKTSSNDVLFGLDIDNDAHGQGMLKKMIEACKKNNNCLILVCHQIANPYAKFKVTYETLKCVLQKTKDMNMRFYTATEISN